MKKKFSLFEQLENNIQTINEIDDCIKITLGPTGKNGIVSNEKSEIKFITTGALLLKSLEFQQSSSNVILKLLEQASAKTYSVSVPMFVYRPEIVHKYSWQLFAAGFALCLLLVFTLIWYLKRRAA